MLGFGNSMVLLWGMGGGILFDALSEEMEKVKKEKANWKKKKKAGQVIL